MRLSSARISLVLTLLIAALVAPPVRADGACAPAGGGAEPPRIFACGAECCCSCVCDRCCEESPDRPDDDADPHDDGCPGDCDCPCGHAAPGHPTPMIRTRPAPVLMPALRVALAEPPATWIARDEAMALLRPPRA